MVFKKIKNYYYQLIHSHATAEEVAQGFAIGLFIGITPTIGLHTVLAIAFAAILKKNEIAAILGAWVVNPLTIFPIYYFLFKVGQWCRPDHRLIDLNPDSLSDFFHMGEHVLVPLWTGSMVVGVPVAMMSYSIVKKIYPYLKKKKKEIREKMGEKFS